MFSSIQGDIAGSRVLDLYAGSGAMGLESISRGCAGALFIDSHPEAVRVIKRNIAVLGVGAKAEVWLADCRKLEGRLAGEFDIVFMDPPYSRGLVPQTLDMLIRGGILAKDALIIAEHEAGVELSGAYTIKQKRYGKANFTFMRMV